MEEHYYITAESQRKTSSFFLLHVKLALLGMAKIERQRACVSVYFVE